jgi:3-isopropylmalate/(R)-2-methylmalate dehydratase small subunit
LSEKLVEDLFGRFETHAPYRLTVDLEQNRVFDGHGFSAYFQVEPFRRYCLLHGLDDIGLTLEHESKITEYERRL